MHEKKTLEIIKELMEQLQGEMSYGKDDFEERLGRKKPEIDVLKIEGKMDPRKMGEMSESDDDDEDMMHPEDEDDAAFLDSREAGPEDELKKRLMKLRA